MMEDNKEDKSKLEVEEDKSKQELKEDKTKGEPRENNDKLELKQVIAEQAIEGEAPYLPISRYAKSLVVTS